MQITTGYLRRVIEASNYAFLALHDGTSRDVYVRSNELRKAGPVSPQEGDEFEFELHERPDGRKYAANLKRLPVNDPAR